MPVSASYDAFCRYYLALERASPSRSLERCTLLELAGDLSGRDVVDLACGEGWCGRQLLAAGARSALGIDICTSMIAEGRARSADEGDRMTFLHADVMDVERDGQFDIVTGAWLLCLAKTRNELAAMYAQARRLLRPGGCFIAVVNNPQYRHTGSINPATHAQVLECVSGEGHQRMRIRFGAREDAVVVDYNWDTASHEAAAEQAGFHESVWMWPKVTPDIRAKHPAGFWDEYETNCARAFLRVRC
ncbi:class I SAM-dependent methyltransferase [Stenotrophomonas sp. CFBP 13718]|uniref:class I SAM-dependent methyltransferase n=1 Tax=Stenotrophomonas sp. CFBP 13718 TaxID=2775304 RepID=UPI0017835B32|nr:class I SAM-dependent methyltransferase [Stenotrophomonas sp. CFBP 13718]MBD8697014.1 class I SAM-dependent methyltransferase [Stenotrophomonas sp. CFBP 13718]